MHQKYLKEKKIPLTIQVVGQLVELMSGKTLVEKYVDFRNPIVTIYINIVPIENTLIDLGDAINVMTIMTMEILQLDSLLPTPTVLELADKSRIKLVGVLDDVIVTLDSWEYPMYFFVIQPNTTMDGHPLILKRPWLATIDAFDWL
jgi:fumarate reductase subunit C